MDDARRDSSPPSGVRAPPLTAAPPTPRAPRAPRPTLASPGRSSARSAARRRSAAELTAPPSPSRARPHTSPQPPPPPPNVHVVPPPPPHSPAPALSGSEAPEVGCRSRRRTAALRTRGPPARGGGPGLAPLPPATRIMALHVSYLPPYAPCVMAASVLCLPSPTPIPHGGGRRPLSGAPRTPAAAPPD